MAGSKSDYLENQILDVVLGDGTFTRPVTTYLGLWTSALSDASTGVTAGEVAAGDYARLPVTNNATNWPDAASGAKSNGVAFEWAAALASWGTITHAGIFDAVTAGNCLYHWDLPVSKVVAADDIFRFPVGSIDLTEA